MTAGHVGSIHVTADDFGLCPEIDTAICLLHDRGIVSRTSLIVNGEHLASSVEALRARPGLEVALHLNLTDGRPVRPAAEVPSLVSAAGSFRGADHYAEAAQIAMGRMRRADVRREWRAQAEVAMRTGLAIAQLNSHGHLHLVPALHGIVIELMREFRIPNVRTVRAFDSARGCLLSSCSLLLASRLRSAGIQISGPSRTLGLRSPGSIDRKTVTQASRPGNGTVEWIVHPSKGSNRYHESWRYSGDQVLEQLLALEGMLA